jgi:nitrogen regulatory protein PII
MGHHFAGPRKIKRTVMRKIEIIMDNAALDRFKSAAAELGISEFDVAVVGRSSTQRVETERLYRGRAFTIDLVIRSKVEFTVPDGDAKNIIDALVTTLQPDSISIFKIDHAVHLDQGRSRTETSGPVIRDRMASRSPGLSELQTTTVAAFGNHRPA